MSILNYPEIQSLKDLYLQYQIFVEVSQTDFLGGVRSYPSVLFTINNSIFKLYVDDEYHDLQNGNALLSLCIVLRALEDYVFSATYLEWCQCYMMDASAPQIIDYYKTLGNIYVDIEKILGKITSYVSDYDFELNAGAAQALRKMKFVV